MKGCLLLMLFFCQMFLKCRRLKHDNRVLKQKEARYRREVKMLRQDQIKWRVLKHDRRNHLIAVKSLLEQNRWEEALHYLDEMLGMAGMGQEITTGNVILDGLLNSKLDEAGRNQIRLETDISIPCNLKLSQAKITVILGNLLDNALTAVLKLPAEKRWIRCRITWRHEVLMLDITNPYMGEIRMKGGRLLSSKGKKGHGLGLLNVSRTVKQEFGDLSIQFHEGLPDGTKLFRVQALLYLDRNDALPVRRKTGKMRLLGGKRE